MSDSEHRGSGLNEAQWQQLKALTTSLNPAQTTWVSGFFAGLDYAARAQLVSEDGAAVATPVPDLTTAPSARTLTILYGTETGNSAALAATLNKQAEACGLRVTTHDMAIYKCRQLRTEQDLVIIASTYGEGDPPQSAAGFFEFIEGHKAPKLADLRFAVLALGDSTYEYYCEAGKRLDRRLEELGAQRLKPRLDCDVDYDEPAAAWIADILASLDNRRPHTGTSATLVRPAPSTQTEDPVFDKRNPFPASIIENIVLTGRGSSKETRHVELSLEGSGLTYEPGDALGFMPSNDPALVDLILTALDLAPSTPVKIKGEPTPLGDALRTDLEITTLTPRFLDHWAGISDADALVRLTQADHVDKRASFIRSHHIIDVIRQFPVNKIDAETFVAGLRPLQPRLYSIASSLAVAPDEAHLTVATVRYDLHGEPRLGVASGHLATRGELDGLLPAYIQKNPHFRLPADDVPIIMIGAGTVLRPSAHSCRSAKRAAHPGNPGSSSGSATSGPISSTKPNGRRSSRMGSSLAWMSPSRATGTPTAGARFTCSTGSRSVHARCSPGLRKEHTSMSAAMRRGWLPMSTWRWRRSWRRKAAWVPPPRRTISSAFSGIAVINAMFIEPDVY